MGRSRRHSLTIEKPSLIIALRSHGRLCPARAGNGEALATFAGQLEQRLKLRLTNPQAAMRSFVQTILLSKKK